MRDDVVENVEGGHARVSCADHDGFDGAEAAFENEEGDNAGDG